MPQRPFTIPLTLAFSLLALTATGAAGATSPESDGANPLFSRAALPATRAPHQSALADLNGDGMKDLVSAVGVAATPITLGVSVMLARGGGEFAPAVHFMTNDPVGTVQVTDLNGDGKPDVVATQTDATEGTFTASALPGIGNGELDLAGDLGLPVFNAVAVGRFVSAIGPPGAITADGSGLRSHVAAPGGFGFVDDDEVSSAGATHLLAADLDGDGIDELVAGGANGSLTLYRELQPARVAHFGELVALEADDVTGDGLPEIIATSATGAVVAFDEELDRVASAPGTRPAFDAAAGDIDGDGLFDLARANQDGTISVFFAGGAPETAVSLVKPATDVLVADVDGDGREDVLAVEPNSSVVEVLSPDGRRFPGLRGSVRTADDSWDIETGDFNGDGKPDLAASQYEYTTLVATPRNVRVHLGDGAGGFGATPKSTLSTDGGPAGIAIADVNGDTRLDLLTGDYATGGVNQFLGNGDGTFGPRMLLSACHFVDGLSTGDFNADGYADAAVICRAVDMPRTLSIMLGTPAGLVRTPILLPYEFNAGSFMVRVGDLNGDHVQDLAVASLNDYCFFDPSCLFQYRGRTVTWFIGAGNGTFSLYRMHHTNDVFASFDIADVGGDAREEMIIPLPFTDRVQIVSFKVDGTRDTVTYTPAHDYPLSVRAGDVTGDGRDDLVMSHGPDAITVTRGLGGGTFAGPIAYAAGNPISDIRLADLNGDKRLDVLGGQYSGVELFVQGT